MLAFRLSRDVGLGIKVLEKLSDPSSRFNASNYALSEFISSISTFVSSRITVGL